MIRESPLKRLHALSTITLLGVVLYCATASAAESTFTLTDDERQWLASHPQITFTGDPNWLPFEGFDSHGNYRGIVSDILQQFSRDSGIQIQKLPSKDWPDALRLAASGQADILSDVVDDEVVWKTHTFTHPYLTNNLVIISNTVGNQIADLNELGNTPVAFIEDYGYIWTLRRKYPATRFVSVHNIQEGLEQVASGEVPFFVASYALTQFELARRKEYALHIRGHLPVAVELGLAVRNDWPELLAIFNRWIDSLTPQERYRIAESWYLNNTQYFDEPQLDWKSIGILLGIIVLLLGWGSHAWISRRELARREVRFANALAAVNAGEWALNPDTGKLYISSDFLLSLGLAPALLPDTLSDLDNIIGPANSLTLQQAIEATQTPNQATDIDVKIHLPAPLHAWLAVKGARIGAGNELAGTVEDITEFMDSEVQRQEKENLLNVLFDTLPDAISLKNIDKVTTLSNQAFQQHFTEQPGVPTNKSLITTLEQADAVVLTTNTPVENRLWVGDDRDAKRYIHFMKVPFHNGQDTPQGVLTICRDVTENYWLTQSLENFRRFADYSGQGFGIANFDTTVDYINPKLLSWLAGPEATMASLRQQPFIQFYPPEIQHKLKQEILPAILGNGLWQGELELICHDGSRLPTFETFFLIRNEHNIPIFIGDVVVDISNQKQQQALMEQARTEAERANASKSMFLANMSHEIRTPLNAVLGYSQLLMRNPQLGADVANQIGRIYTAGQRLLNLINDVLDLSKIEAGKLSLMPTLYDIHRDLEDLIELHQAKAEARHIRLHADIQLASPEFIFADKTKVSQILMNVIDNAIKFTPAGSVTLEARREGERLIFTVTDTGAGISAEDLAQLFKPFSQGQSGVVNGGTGLGLVLSRRIAEAMNGNLILSSEAEKGTQVIIELPFPRAHQGLPTQPRPTANKHYRLATGIKRRILIIEDDELSQDVLNQLLLSMCFETRLASNGEQGLQALDHRIDLVFTDIRMPVMDGVELLKTLRQQAQYRELPVIAISASSLEHERRHYLEQGFTDFVSKPLAVPDIISVIEAALQVQLIADAEALESPSMTALAAPWQADSQNLSAGSEPVNAATRLGDETELLAQLIAQASDGDVDAVSATLDTLFARQPAPELQAKMLEAVRRYDFDALIEIVNSCCN